MKTVKLEDVPVTISPRGPRVRPILGTEFAAVTEVLLGSGETLPAHVTPVDVLFYVRAGSGYVVIGDDRLPVTEGTIVESPKGIPHGLVAGDGPFDVLVIKTPNPNWKP